MTSDLDRYVHPRSISVVNNKGGVGKTTLVSHLGGLLALKGFRVLAVDLDEQGNLGDDLGFTARGISDHGAGLAQAVVYGSPLYVLRDVRPGLDVVPGGKHIGDLASALVSRVERRYSAQETVLALATAIATIAEDYDLVLYDCPPDNATLQEAALLASKYVFIPTKTDMSSRRGMVKMAELFTSAQMLNPGLTLLGVLLFGVTPAAKAIRKIAVAWIEEALGGQAPVFASTVRHVETPAFHVRERGQLAHELELGKEAGVSAALAKSVAGAAADLEAVTVETVTRMLEIEAREQGVIA